MEYRSGTMHPDPIVGRYRPKNVRALYFRLGLTMFAVGMLALACFISQPQEAWWIPGLITTFGGGVLLWFIVRAFRRPSTEILADHFLVFSVAFLAYFVLGALLLPFGPQEQANDALGFYPTDAIGALRVTAVNFTGFGIALLTGSLISRKFAYGLATHALRVGSHLKEHWIITGFLIMGMLASYAVLAVDLGMREGLPSGISRMVSRFLLVAIFIAAGHKGPHGRKLRLAAIGVTAVEATAGLLLFNKSAVLLPLIALAAGFGWRYGVRRTALPALFVLFTVFLILGRPTAYGRNTFLLPVGAGLQERAELLLEGLFGKTGDLPEDANHPWARFCYVPSQVAALDFYDAGFGGDDLEKLGWVFLPRFLFPEKPIITQTGVDFYSKITGQIGVSVGQGIFANGYYNLGWLGVVIFSMMAGLILAQTSAFAQKVFARRALVWVPFALLGAHMALRIDGAFLADYWGPFVFFLYLIVPAGVMGSGRRRNVVSGS